MSRTIDPAGPRGAEPSPHRGRPVPLLVATADPELGRRLAELAAAAGIPADSVPSLGPGWSRRPGIGLVLVDAAVEVAAERRDGVLLVSAGEPDPQTWRRAVQLGAEQVVTLPEGEPWLLDRILDVTRPGSAAAVVGVIGGRGGAGVSTLAVGLAVVAARSGVRTVLVDADPLGGGLDLLVGVEREQGLRWEDLAGARGRLQPGLLPSLLPATGALAVLSWGRPAAAGEGGSAAADAPAPPGPGPVGGDPGECGWAVRLSAGAGSAVADLDPDAVTAVMNSAVREFDLVVVDFSRRFGAADLVALRACRTVVVLVPAEVRAVAAASGVCALLDLVVADQRLVVRGPAPSGLPADAVADALGLPLAGELRSEPAVASALDRGEPLPDRPRGALTMLSRRLLTQVLAA